MTPEELQAIMKFVEDMLIPSLKEQAIKKVVRSELRKTLVEILGDAVASLEEE